MLLSKSSPRNVVIMLTLSIVLIGTGISSFACDQSNVKRFIVSESNAPFVPIIESIDLTVGVNRLVFTLLDHNTPPQFPQNTVFSVRYYEPVPGGFRFRIDSPAKPIRVGTETFYVSPAPFDRPGQWHLQVTAKIENADPLIGAKLPFFVNAETLAPMIGDPVTINSFSSKSSGNQKINISHLPTLASQKITLRKSVEQQRPFVVVTTTMGGCPKKNICDRIVEQIKIIDRDTEVSVIHIETPHNLDMTHTKEKNNFHRSTTWILGSNPWIYIVDSKGIISERFEILVETSKIFKLLTEH